MYVVSLIAYSNCLKDIWMSQPIFYLYFLFEKVLMIQYPVCEAMINSYSKNMRLNKWALIEQFGQRKK